MALFGATDATLPVAGSELFTESVVSSAGSGTTNTVSQNVSLAIEDGQTATFNMFFWRDSGGENNSLQVGRVTGFELAGTAVVPEPSTAMLAMFALLGLAAGRRRRNRG